MVQYKWSEKVLFLRDIHCYVCVCTKCEVRASQEIIVLEWLGNQILNTFLASVHAIFYFPTRSFAHSCLYFSSLFCSFLPICSLQNQRAMQWLKERQRKLEGKRQQRRTRKKFRKTQNFSSISTGKVMKRVSNAENLVFHTYTNTLAMDKHRFSLFCCIHIYNIHFTYI